MKASRLLTAALALGVLAGPTLAQTTATQPGTTAMDPMAGMSEADRYKMVWVYRNLDDASVKRLQAMGLDEATIRGIANIALRTGLPLDFVVRQVMISGLPLTAVAAQYGVATTAITEDIPGMGMSNPAMKK